MSEKWEKMKCSMEWMKCDSRSKVVSEGCKIMTQVVCEILMNEVIIYWTTIKIKLKKVWILQQ